MDEVLTKIVRKAQRSYDMGAIRDGLGYLTENYDREACGILRKACTDALKEGRAQDYFGLYRLGLLVAAPHEFDCYMQYLEIDRPPEKRFYMPRRKVLKRFVDNLQDLSDGVITELFVSQPPRTGKTTLAIMFMSWIVGKNTEGSNLYCSYSDTITKKFYDGLMEIMTDAETYNYRDIFPNAPIVRANAADETIDLARKKHYPSFTARSIYGTLNGATDCDEILVADDLCSGIEEAMNKDRLINLWEKVDNNMIPRAKSSARILWIGTRWSVIDPAGIRQDLLLNDPHFRDYKWRSINVPALNDLDESNFDYKYGVGFDTKYYKQRRASFERNNDLVSWACQFQGTPYDREGSIFSPDDLMYYNGVLPEREPDRVFMAVDPAWGGGDFVAAPVCFQYGNEVYVHDVVYDNGDKSKTQPKLARTAIKYGVTAMYVEASKTTADYAEGIDKLIRAEGKRVNIQKSMKNAMGHNKNDRIIAASPDIRDHMIFRESGTRSKEYELFMANVYSFKIIGKNKNDDAPDSLQMAISFAFPKYTTAVAVARRPF